MTDEELDREWKPNGRRPQSTIARSFSLELMDIFRIDNSITDLDEQVDKRKQQLNTQTSELEALEARIREMEQRLRTSKPSDGDSSLDQRLAAAAAAGSSASPRGQRPPVSNIFDKGGPGDGAGSGEQEQEQPNNKSRPGTARQNQQAVPGALPPTPVASEDGDGE